MTPSWMLRDDVPARDCDCSAAAVGGEHRPRCSSLLLHGPYYYAGRDLEGHWWMPGIKNAARFSYRDAHRVRRELSAHHPRPLTLERAPVQAEVAA